MNIPNGYILNVCGYIRVSTKDQMLGISPETQLKGIQDYCERMRWNLTKVFIDDISGKTTNRDDFQKCLLYIKEFDQRYMVMYMIDRFSREAMDHYDIKKYLRSCNCGLASATQDIVSDPIIGEFLEGFFILNAQLDNRMKAKRVRDNMNFKASKGYWLSKAWDGYKTNPITKLLEIDPARKFIIESILNMYDQGFEIAYIRDWLNSNHYLKKNNTVWTNRDIWNKLERAKVYAGSYNWGEIREQTGEYPPYISLAQAFNILSRMHNKKYQREPQSDFIFNYEIEKGKPFLTCAKCSNRIKSCKSRSKTGLHYYYYYCANSDCKQDKKSVQKEVLEKQIRDMIAKLQPDSKMLLKLGYILKQKYNESIKGHKQSALNAKKLITKLKQDREGIIRMRRDLELSKDDFDREISNNDVALIDANKTYNTNKIAYEKIDLLLDYTTTLMTHVELLYDSFSTAHKQYLLSTIFYNGITLENGVCRTPEISPLFRAEGLLEADLVQVVTQSVNKSNSISFIDRLIHLCEFIIPKYDLGIKVNLQGVV